MSAAIKRVENAIEQIKQGKMIILTDNPDRENEGDIIIAAEYIDEAKMAFILRECSGIVCLAMSTKMVDAIPLPLMINETDNTCSKSTAFTISIDAKENVSTGVSAADRCQTIHTTIADDCTLDDLIRPGHIFPLKARPNGVLERKGHTEGSVDLMRLAGLKHAAVICEIMNKDGTMSRGDDLDKLAKEHNLLQVTIDDLVEYRLAKESMVLEQTSATLPTDQFGEFEITALRDLLDQQEHLILHKPSNNNQPPLIRIHSSCATGDIFSSLRCDCQKQLHYALEQISLQGGYLIYLNQEGRGIGLVNKIKSYALQQQGLDTVEANHELGFEADLRNYQLAANIIHQLKLPGIKLLTNNPDKMMQLQNFGIQNIQRVSMPTFICEQNEHYLHTKSKKLNHLINLDERKIA